MSRVRGRMNRARGGASIGRVEAGLIAARPTLVYSASLAIFLRSLSTVMSESRHVLDDPYGPHLD